MSNSGPGCRVRAAVTCLTVAVGEALHAMIAAIEERLGWHSFAHAIEDLPEDARDQIGDITSEPAGLPWWARIAADIENAGLDLYGNLERVDLLRFLSQYPVTPYTYDLSATLARGERPSPAKLNDLARRQHYRT